MKRKIRTLFMTVGTGVNHDSDTEGYKRLAQGMYASLKKIYPDYIVFFASEISKNTIDYIKELYQADDDEFIEGEDYEVVIIDQIDNFNFCFEAFEAKIWHLDVLSVCNGLLWNVLFKGSCHSKRRQEKWCCIPWY